MTAGVGRAEHVVEAGEAVVGGAQVGVGGALVVTEPGGPLGDGVAPGPELGPRPEPALAVAGLDRGGGGEHLARLGHGVADAGEQAPHGEVEVTVGGERDVGHGAGS